MEIRLFGPVRVLRDGAEVPLPRSRKVRVLLAVLALAKEPVSRSRLSDLLWNGPNDPRGELRWCVSRLRAVVDDEVKRVVAPAPSLLALRLDTCSVDAAEAEALSLEPIDAVPTPVLERVAASMAGEFLEGLLVDGAELSSWLTAARQRLRAKRLTMLEALVHRAPPGTEEHMGRLAAWLQAAPFNVRAHQAMIAALVEGGWSDEAEAHVAGAIRAFELEGLDWTPLREALRESQRGPRRVAAMDPPPPSVAPDRPAPPRRRGSVVVLPFTASSPQATQVAHGLTDDIITRLARLRALFVIARGTAYALGERGVAPHEAGRILGVGYVLSGTVRRDDTTLRVRVELAETEGAGIVWTDDIDGAAGDAFAVLDVIVDRIVASIAEQIERAESKSALAKPSTSLDAWEAYHRGLWHMYRFTERENELAATFFRAALELDPTFARAHSGMSFTHFQNVFLGLTPDRDRQMDLALEAAARSLAADDRDPGAHWAMGRALWLRGGRGECVAELERSIELSPSFALGHYTLGFVHAQSGDPETAIRAADYSRQLSPFDPLQFGMLASRALSLLRLGQKEAAAEWALKAAGRPNAHVHILMIAAVSLALARRTTEARDVVARLRTKVPRYSIEDLVRAFRFDAEAEAILRKGAKRLGLD